MLLSATEHASILFMFLIIDIFFSYLYLPRQKQSTRARRPPDLPAILSRSSVAQSPAPRRNRLSATRQQHSRESTFFNLDVSSSILNSTACHGNQRFWR
ncbi:hypothetical protein CEP52_006981 [Fusarium oligoseptatum]|uniref:Uncharacterized protein n=1 Tax=Fusarium oligoseptatum TaxID=2604345 RepID=A0A428TQB0_9HYPO|nr:hypothetical protein CEP52_006981 [Fusarium oligoseptatum]